jgi:hypothetical protein
MTPFRISDLVVNPVLILTKVFRWAFLWVEKDG